MRSAASLPFKLSAQPRGTQKAYSEFQKTYGQQKGHDIFLQYAEDHGTGNTIRQKCNSVFKKGSKIK